MTPASLVDRLFDRHRNGLPLFPVSGGDGNNPDPPPPAVPDLGRLVADAVAKHGDQTSAFKAVISDLIAAREDNGKLRARLPAEGAVVLSGDDAKAWGAYSQLGKPSDLRKVVDEHATLSQKVGTYERDEVLRGVADQAGVKFAVLKTLAGPALAFETKPVKGKDGKEVPAVHVKDGDAPPVPFDDYATKHWGDFLPSLRPGAAKPEPQRPPGTPTRLDPHAREHEPDPATTSETRRQKLRAVGLGSF